LTEKKLSSGISVWSIPLFFLHLIAVYAIVTFGTPWLAGWTWGTLMPLLQQRTSSNRFEFLFSHIFVFSFLPAFMAGLTNARFRHKAALLVWLVPTAILVYELVIFRAPSVLQSHSSAAFHQYFGGDFHIPEFRDWHDLLTIASSNSDMTRGMAQLKFTALFYGGIGYSLGAWVCLRMNLNEKLWKRIEVWEKQKF
jgi:hypothetical protein